MTRKRFFMFAGVSTLAGILLGVIALIALDASLLTIPLPMDRKGHAGLPKTETAPLPDGSRDYKAVAERNLFRAKLQAEIQTPKSEKEIEEELLVSILKPMILKGIMTGQQKRDFYAVIDRGGQKGVWTYEVGEAIERGLTVTDIKKDGVVVEKGDFVAALKLFARSFERLPSAHAATLPKENLKKEEPRLAKKEQLPPTSVDYGKEIRREGTTTVISKSLAEKMKTDNTMILSSVAIKLSTDASGKPNGYKVVGVDKGSLAQKLGVLPDDVLQEVNGYQLKNAEETKKAQDALKNASRFELKVLRRGKMETLRYEIR